MAAVIWPCRSSDTAMGVPGGRVARNRRTISASASGSSSTIIAQIPFSTRQIFVVPVDNFTTYRYNFTTQPPANPRGYADPAHTVLSHWIGLLSFTCIMLGIAAIAFNRREQNA